MVGKDADSSVGALLDAERPRPTLTVRESFETVRDGLFGRRSALAVSRYLLLQPLGTGGMGTVWAAYDPELDRRVAIKVLRADTPNGRTREESQRLLREAQAIARINHPNVVAVHDVGTYADELSTSDVEGTVGVFVVMELVDGTDVGEWIAASRPDVRTVLRMLVGAGRGIAAAHAVGIVHRDIKPSNVLVGNDGRARVADFGLARASGSMTNDIAGTPMFMAPEQHIGAAADARTDQFGFCATLHLALHGRPPFAGKTVEALLDAKRQGRVELPAEHRVPAWVQRILARGLSPSPEDRFASMTDLVDALARDPGRTRRRLALLAGGIASVGAGLLGQRIAIERRADRCADEAVFASTWNDDVASGIEDRFVATQLPYAVQSWTSTRRILDARWQTWATERAHACGDETLPAPELQEREACLARRRGELESLVDLFTLADAGLVEHSVAAAGALAPSELCRDPRWRDSDGEARPQADLALLRAEALLAAGRLTDAAQAAADLQQTAASDEDAGLRVRATLVLARTHVMEGDYVGAEDELHHALLAAERAGAHGLGDRALALLVSVVGYHQHRPGEAMRYAELARVRIEASGGSPVVTAMLERGIAMVRQSEGRFDEALTHYEHALAIDEELYGSDHPESTNTLNGMGAALYFAGQHAAAEARLRESLQRTVAVLGENHPRTARAYGNLAGPVLAQDRGDEAVELSTRALAIFRRLHEDSHPVIAETMTNLANAMVVAHRPDEALTTVDEALALLRRRGGGDPEARVLALFVRADALHQLHRLDQELAVRREAVTLAEAELGTPHARLADALVGVAASYEDLGRPREALPFHERGAAMLARTLGAEHPRTLEAQLALAATRRLVAAADVRDPEDGRAR